MPPAVHEVTRTTPDGLFQEQKVQEPARGGFGLEVNVALVTVNAIVRDRQGAVVDGLRAEDFALYDNSIALDNAIADLRRGYTLGFTPSRPGYARQLPQAYG